MALVKLTPACLIVALAFLSNAQTSPSQAQPHEADGLTLHIDVNLVQVDAVVTGRGDQPITNLKPEDFEILEDGKPQPITNFSFINLATANRAIQAALAPPQAPDRDHVNRTVVLIADDLNLSFESTARVRQAIRKFVDTQMGPKDFVSIARTSTGLGALENFTNDKRALEAAADAVHWYMTGYAGIDSVPDESSTSPRVNSRVVSYQREPSAVKDEAVQSLYARGTLTSLMSIIENMRTMPGRKAVILFSDGVPILPGGVYVDAMNVLLQRVADLANRSSVVLNCIDALGLQAGAGPVFEQQQAGMMFLAKQTGGRTGINGNDFKWFLNKMLDDMDGYYLIGYKPQGATFHKSGERASFRHIQVRVKQHGLTVRTRTGFYGQTDAESIPTPLSDSQKLVTALKSPFALKDIPLKLTLQFLSDGPKSNRISTMLHIDAHAITFEKREDGNHHATIELLLTGHDEDGRPVERAANTIEVNMPDKQYEVALNSGFVLTQQVAVTRSGAAQVRAAVRDMTSGRLGSTSGFLLLPDLKKKHLVIGTIVLGTTANVTLPSNSAVRVFTADQPVPYRFTMFNPRTTAGNIAEVETQVKVFHEGREVWASDPMVTKATPGVISKQLVATSNLYLAKNFEPGEYYLQVVAKDLLAGKKTASSMQWINFDLSR